MLLCVVGSGRFSRLIAIPLDIFVALSLHVHHKPERRLAVVVVNFVHGDGSRESHFGRVGETVMDVALDNGVEGIRAQCGGGCTCSTCHCYVCDKWFIESGSMHPDEKDILEYTPQRRRNSRLACQIRLTEKLDGIVVQPCVYDT